MSNPIDLSFDKKVELVTAANRLPKGEGLTFIKFVEIQLNQIMQRTGNKLEVLKNSMNLCAVNTVFKHTI